MPDAKAGLEAPPRTAPMGIGVAATLLLALACAGCGQKGALYLPDRQPQAVPAKPAAAPAPAPADAQPDPADPQRKPKAPAGG